MFVESDLIDEMTNLRKFALRLTRNLHDADDLLQMTLLRAMEKKHMFETDTNLFRWASKIMFNIFVSNYRQKTKFQTQYDPEIYISNQSVAPRQETEMELKKVGEAMEILSNDHKEIGIHPGGDAFVFITDQGMSRHPDDRSALQVFFQL